MSALVAWSKIALIIVCGEPALGGVQDQSRERKENPIARLVFLSTVVARAPGLWLGQTGSRSLPRVRALQHIGAVGVFTSVLTLGSVAAIEPEPPSIPSRVALPTRDPIASLPSEAAPTAIPGNSKNVETVTFGNVASEPVIVIRGRAATKDDLSGRNQQTSPTKIETVTFSGSMPGSVRVVKLGPGSSDKAPATDSLVSKLSPNVADRTTETIQFLDPNSQAVTVIKGSVFAAGPVDMFTAASQPELDRVALAVEAAESSMGTDLRMWRADPYAAQGPMQVTEAAALDVGGGNRFSETENRALGRAYLDHLYRRYGNWPDAVAAYNWGPGNVDGWSAAGRSTDKMPLEVERYRERVLRRAGLSAEANGILTGDPLQAVWSHSTPLNFGTKSSKSLR